MRATIARAFVCAAALLARPTAARADGAFPDSLAIFVPANKPHEIVLATNFGLIISEDDGATWYWVCEQAVASQARLYQMGPPPGNRLLAVSPLALVMSTDGACSWQVAGGALDGAVVSDAFPDPNDAMHVLAIGVPGNDSNTYEPPVLYESHDGGVAFTTIYTAGRGWSLAGVEVPRTAPQAIYVAAYLNDASNKPHPNLLHSTNGGMNFQSVDMTGSLGMSALRLIAVDAQDASRVYLRLLATGGDQFAVYDGTAATMTLQLDAPMSFFLERADGRLYTGTRDHAFISSDGGRTFQPWTAAPHLRALGERAGVLYAVGDNFADHFAVATSTDEGAHWHPLLSYDHICDMLSCGQVRTICAAPWQTLIGTFQIPANVCGGGGGSGGGGGGCGCSVGAAAGPPVAGLFVLLALLVRGRLRSTRPGRGR